MNIADAIMWGQYSVLTIMLIRGPVLIAAMAVGFAISLTQAVTQIQEMTLVFVPKILVVMLVSVLLGGWMLEQAVVFGQRCFQSASVAIPSSGVIRAGWSPGACRGCVGIFLTLPVRMMGIPGPVKVLMSLR